MPFPGEHLRVSQMWLERRNSGPKICTHTVSYKQRRSFPPKSPLPPSPTPPSPLPPASDALLKTKLLHGYSRCTQHTGLLCVTNFPLYSSHLDFDFLAPSLVTVRQDSVCVHALQTLIYIHLHTYVCGRFVKLPIFSWQKNYLSRIITCIDSISTLSAISYLSLMVPPPTLGTFEPRSRDRADEAAQSRHRGLYRRVNNTFAI